ncbi:SURF1 family cytochrome oxidase biogenesis protein [Catenulispora yoronensis]
MAGVYDPGHQFLARNHQVNGNPGFWIITPLTLSDGTSVLVNRGWIPTDSADQQQSPAIRRRRPAGWRSPGGSSSPRPRATPASATSPPGCRPARSAWSTPTRWPPRPACCAAATPR